MKKRQIKNTIILFNEYFYKEVDLDSYDKNEIIISNNYDECDININIQGHDIYIKLKKINNFWVLEEGLGVYFTMDEIKISQKKLCHGNEIKVKSLKGEEIFKIHFFLDFSSGKENYDKGIEISDLQEVKFGRSSDNTIVIDDPLVDEYHCVLKINENKSIIVDLDSRYNVYINGQRVYESQTIFDNDFIIICGYKFLYKDKRVYFSNYSDKITIGVNGIEYVKSKESLLTYPEFLRTPRFIYKLPDKEIEVVAPPTKDKKQSIVDTLIGVIPMIGMAILATSVGFGSNKLYRIGMVVITIISSSLIFIINNIRIKKKIKKRNKMYIDYIERKEEEISKLYQEQKENMQLLYPTVEEAIDIVYDFKRRLWEKNYDDDDFLKVFIGKGTVDISFKIKIPKEEFGEREDELLFLPNELEEKYNKIENMPISLDMKEHKAIGIIGEGNIHKFIKNIIVELVAFHYYEDVNLVCLANKEEEELWQWQKWLSHVWDSNKKIRFIGIGKESSHYVLSCLNEILKQRIDTKSNGGKKGIFKPYYIMVITDSSLLENEEIVKILESGIDLGITVIYAYKDIKAVPRQCTTIINIDKNCEGTITMVNDGNSTVKFKYKEYSDDMYDNVSRRLAPVYVKTMFSESTLPKSISLYELYKIKSVRQLNIIENWKNHDVRKTLAAPLGINSLGEVLELNLHEKFHGPHGLVAGTTGSGKSEILQSLIISLALNYHPYDISFILIDYKGGGMANLFSDLPHLIGTITNLDGNLVNRSLSLIKSELKRRQKIFSKYDVNHIDGYKSLEKANENLEPLPHLVIIADEFAELKSDQPEFMKELVSTARIGRSLGVHLILATQKPSGVVDSQIWSNSKFKLCLKVQDAADSNELLKKPDAASIVEPGRAYFQVGNNEIYQLFQSAWSGAKKYVDDDISSEDIEISEISIEGRRKLIYSSKDKNKGKKQITQLEESIQHINKVFYNRGFKKVDNCWIPPLNNIILLKDLIPQSKYFYNKRENTYTDIKSIMGIVDCPDEQKQFVMEHNLSDDGNLLIIGGSGYGKTTLIQTMVLSLSFNYRPDEVNMYILDFGTRTLKIFDNMPHVGDVILSDEEEKIRNLFKVIKKEVAKRKLAFSGVGASSLKSYRLATNKVMPQIVLFIDNYISFKELYDDLQDEILFITREGVSLGISLIITNSTTNGIAYKLQSNFKKKIAFTCTDNSEYMNLFGVNRVKPTNIKGRALISYNGINEMQVAIWGEQEQEFERVEEIKEAIEVIKENYTGRSAPKIPTTPKIIELESVLREVEFEDKEELTIACGFNSESLDNILLPMKNYPLFTLVGESKTGKTNMMKNIIVTCERYWRENEFIIFDSNVGALNDVKKFSVIKKYAATKDEYVEILNYIMEEFENRRETVTKLLREGVKEKDILKNMKASIILIENITDVITNLDRREMEKLDLLAKNCKGLNMMIVACGTDSDFKTNMYTARFLKAMKESQVGIVFDSLNTQSFFGVRLKYNAKEEELKKGDGYLVINNKFYRIKTPKV